MQFTTTIPEFSNSISLFGPLFAFSIIIGIIGFIVQIILAYYVYNHAKNNNDPNAALWGILVFFSTVIGLFLYFLIGVKRQQSQYQNNYQPYSTNQQFNSSKIQPGQVFYCKNCGNPLDTESNFCQSCGAKI